MPGMSISSRVFLFATSLLAAYQIAIGIEGQTTLPLVSYTVAFGMLLVTAVLLLIVGFELLDNREVAIIATLIPLSLSLGLVWQYLPGWRILYLSHVLGGFALVVLTQIAIGGKTAAIAVTLVHGVAGGVILLLPIDIVWQGKAALGFALVGLGGALIGSGGLLLSLLRTGKNFISKETLLGLLPALLLITTAAFVGGFAFSR